MTSPVEVIPQPPIIDPEVMERVSSVANYEADLITEAVRLNPLVFSATKVGRAKSEQHWADLLNPTNDERLSVYLMAVEKQSGIKTRGHRVETQLAKKADGYLEQARDGLAEIEQSSNLMGEIKIYQEQPELNRGFRQLPSRQDVLMGLFTEGAVVRSVVEDIIQRFPTKDESIKYFLEYYADGDYQTAFPEGTRVADGVAEKLVTVAGMVLERKEKYWDRIKNGGDGARRETLKDRFNRVRLMESRAFSEEDRRRSDSIDRHD